MLSGATAHTPAVSYLWVLHMRVARSCSCCQQMYPDAAHKPEMVISLSWFCGFAGFLTPDHMAQLLQDYPQFNEVLGAHTTCCST